MFVPVMSLVPWSQSLTSCKLSLPGQIASCAISIDLCTLCYKQWLQLIDISALLELVDLTVLAHVIRLAGLQKQSSGASAVQHTCAVLQDTCMCCLHACFDSKPSSKPSKVVHLSSMSGNAIHGCLQTWWPLSSRAVVLVLCNTLVLYCKFARLLG